jgi:hypothetical protein
MSSLAGEYWRIMGCTRFTPKAAKAPTLAPIDPAALTPHLPPEEFGKGTGRLEITAVSALWNP